MPDEAMIGARERLALAYKKLGLDFHSENIRAGASDASAPIQALAATLREVSAAIKSGDPEQMQAFVLPEPVDPDLLLAREAMKSVYPKGWHAKIDNGELNDSDVLKIALAAIKLDREKGAVG